MSSATVRVLVAACVMLGAASCGDGEEPPPAVGVTEEPKEPTPSPSPAPEAGGEGAPEEPEEGGEGGGEGAEDDDSAALFPDPVTPGQGGTYFAVYFAVTRTDTDDPAIQAATTDLRNLGFEPSVGGIDCDEGAKEALGLDSSSSYTDVGLYFLTKQDADMFVTLYDPGVVGTTKVKTFCLD